MRVLVSILVNRYNRYTIITDLIETVDRDNR